MNLIGDSWVSLNRPLFRAAPWCGVAASKRQGRHFNPELRLCLYGDVFSLGLCGFKLGSPALLQITVQRYSIAVL